MPMLAEIDDRHAVGPVDLERRSEHLADALGDHLGPGGERDPLGQDHELVPSQTTDRVTRPAACRASRPATACSNWSPAPWPSESLASLKLSRSMK